MTEPAPAHSKGADTGRDLRRLPKVDLHVHLEGSMRAATVAELAARHGMPLPSSLEAGRYAFRDFADFIEQYTFACACLREPADFHRIAYEFCADESAEGVRYAEVTFSVAEYVVNLEDGDRPLAAVLEGLAHGGADFGIETRVVVDLVRGFPLEVSERALECAIRRAGEGVVAVGIGGSERFPPAPFAPLFRRARDAGLGAVPHAGEAEGPQSIRGALDDLGADRIGHGIRALEDPELVAELRTRRVPLEVCLTSNLRTGVVRTLEEHPLPRLVDAGLVVTVNSDDPAMFDSPLVGEYEALRRIFGFDDRALAGLARAGVRASFASPAVRRNLELAIDGWLEPAGESEGLDPG